MELIGGFTISSIGTTVKDQIDDVITYDEISDESLRDFLERLVNEKKIIIGEKCEGDIEMDDRNIRLEYKWCSEVGEDWDSDVWEDEVLVLSREEYVL